MITSEQLEEFEGTLERCDGYVTLGMLREAQRELESVPRELKSTLPYLAACLNLCRRFEWWEQAADLGMQMLQRWPGREDIREVTLQCLMKAGGGGGRYGSLFQGA